jgi:hypothetical protein
VDIKESAKSRWSFLYYFSLKWPTCWILDRIVGAHCPSARYDPAAVEQAASQAGRASRKRTLGLPWNLCGLVPFDLPWVVSPAGPPTQSLPKQSSPRPALALTSRRGRCESVCNVETRPGTISRISRPKLTASLSMVQRACSEALLLLVFPNDTASSTSSLYRGICAALYNKEGLVVASCGLYSGMASKSPLSATTVVMVFKCSSVFIGHYPEASSWESAYAA